MELPTRKRLAHNIPQWVPQSSCFFVTINCNERDINQLCQLKTGNAVLSAAAFYHEKLTWYCRLMLLMPDHLHAIINLQKETGMKTVLSNWKKYLARTADISWQRDFFDHRLRNHFEEEEKRSYILMNPVRKGLCKKAEDWTWVFYPPNR